MLVGSGLAGEMQELKAWAQPPRTPSQITAFVEDLAEWLSFQSLVHCASPGAGHATSPLGREEALLALAQGGKAGLGGSVLPVLVAEAQRPGVMKMMSEVRRWGCTR